MINGIWKREFENFLNEKTLLELFNHNYNNENAIFYFDIYDHTNHAYDYIINAFDWDLTEQGESFWYDINDQWYDHIERNNLIKFDIST